MNFDWVPHDFDDGEHDAISGRSAFLQALLTLDIPEKVDKHELAALLTTQRGLAKLEFDAFSIRPMSLNTLKKHADGEGRKWVELDKLRLKVVERLCQAPQTETRPPPRTIAWYKEELKRLNDKLKVKTEDLVIMTRAFDKAFSNARSIAHESGQARLKSMCARQEEEIRHELSFRHRHGELEDE
jgi:hypothetical protein